MTQTMQAGWLITRDHIETGSQGTMGPRGFTGQPHELDIPFKLYDGDGELYYTGRMNMGALDEYGDSDPLYCFGMPNAGATTLKVKLNGTWQVV